MLFLGKRYKSLGLAKRVELGKPRARQDWAVEQITIEPNITYTALYHRYCQKFGKFSDRTFTIDWKKARERAEQFRSEVHEAKIKQAVEVEAAQITRDILSKFDAMEILSNIARGETGSPSSSERTKAIETLAKLDGWMSPTKVEQKTTFQIDDLTSLSEEELIEHYIGNTRSDKKGIERPEASR